MKDIIKRKKLSDVLPKNSSKKSSSVDLREELEYLSSKRSIPKIFLWFLLIIFIIFIILAASTAFTRVRLDVWPKTAVINIDHTFEATKEPSGSENGQQLVFGVVENVISERSEIPASGEEEVSENASGTITVYNNYDRQPQILIVNTRFESPDGKIYRIREQITVPGMKVVDDKEVAGSIDVKVYADEPGEEYNLSSSSFTIPGFKDSPRYEKFSAETKTPISGGFVGLRKVVNNEDLENARENIRQKLDGEALEIKDLPIAPNLLLFPEGVFVSYDFSEIDNESTDDKLVLEGNKIMTGIVFNKEELSSFLADRFIPNYQLEELRITNWSELKFSLEDQENFDPSKSNSLKFKLEGSPRFVWEIEEDKLKEDLSGLSKNKYQDIIGEYTSISRVKPSFLPPWIGTIPENTRKIKVNIIEEDR